MYKLKLIMVLVLLQLVNSNCGAQKAAPNLTTTDKDIILDVFRRKGISNSVLLKETLNEKLKNDLDTKMVFENGNYPEFGDLRLIFSDEIISEVFNKTQVDYFINQLDTHTYFEKSPIKNMTIQDTIQRNQNVITLSVPVYTKDLKYAIISYGSGNRAFEIFESGILLYKNIDGNWVFQNGFFNSFQ